MTKLMPRNGCFSGLNFVCKGKPIKGSKTQLFLELRHQYGIFQVQSLSSDDCDATDDGAPLVKNGFICYLCIS